VLKSEFYFRPNIAAVLKHEEQDFK